MSAVRHAVLTATFLTAALLTTSKVGAADVGRYQILPGPPMILLDTPTGKTWRYDDGKWLPLEITRPKTVVPKPKESTQQRWQRESEARRLKLKNSKLKPAEKKPLKTLLDRLVPKQ